MSRNMTRLLILLLAIPVAAQAQPSQNAALRYWQAFAFMQDAATSQANARELDRIAKGELPWDEAKFGRLLDQNSEALFILHRASQLPSCDWGLDTELGPAAPVAHIAKARALARLNALAAIRLAAQGKLQRAVDTWLTGFRFAEHLTQDGTLIGTLVASAAASAQMRTISQSLDSTNWDDASLSRLETQLRALPPYLFDWAAPMHTEHQALSTLIRQASNPSDAMRPQVSETGLAEVRSAASQSQSQLDDLFTRAAAAFQLPASQAQQRLLEIQQNLNTATPFVQKSVPNLARINDTRSQLEADRSALIAKISRKRSGS